MHYQRGLALEFLSSVTQEIYHCVVMKCDPSMSHFSGQMHIAFLRPLTHCGGKMYEKFP